MRAATLTSDKNKIGHVVHIDKSHPKYGGQLARVKRFIGEDKAQVAILSSHGGIVGASAMIKLKYLREIIENGKKEDPVGKED